MSDPIFYSDGDMPRRMASELVTTQKILGAVLDGGGGGGGSPAQMVTYTSGTPAAPLDPTKPAIAYDPTGNLPTKGWDTGTLTWN